MRTLWKLAVASSCLLLATIGYGSSRPVTAIEVYEKRKIRNPRRLTSAEIKAASTAGYRTESVSRKEIEAAKKPGYKSRPVNRYELKARQSRGGYGTSRPVNKTEIRAAERPSYESRPVSQAEIKAARKPYKSCPVKRSEIIR